MIVYATRSRTGEGTTEVSSIGEAVRMANASSGFVIVGMSQPSAEELRRVEDAFGTPSFVDDALRRHQRPRLIQRTDAVLAIVHALDDLDWSPVDGRELDLLIGPAYAILVGEQAPDIANEIRGLLDELPHVASLGPMAALWALLHTVVDRGELLSAVFFDEAQRITEMVFEGDSDESESIYALVSRVDPVLRSIDPLLPILDDLENGRTVGVPDELRPLMGNVGDHARVLSKELERLSDRLNGLLSANLARVGVRQNETIQTMSAWAAIVAVPAIITGVYGMNFANMPELSWSFGYPAALGIMALIVFLLWWNFRRIGWL